MIRSPHSAAVAAAFAAALSGTSALAQPAVADAIPLALDGLSGSAARGRIVVADREGAHCLLCHALPMLEERFHGDLAPSLSGVGSRLSPGQIRLRIVDSSRLHADTIMPPYFRTQDLNRVARHWQGRTVLTAQQVEDVVAYLSSLQE